MFTKIHNIVRFSSTSELKRTTNDKATGAMLKFGGNPRNLCHVITVVSDPVLAVRSFTVSTTVSTTVSPG